MSIATCAPAHVRDWHEADNHGVPRNVCFRGKADVPDMAHRRLPLTHCGTLKAVADAYAYRHLLMAA